MSKYPITYKEYKIRVIDLLLEDATFDEKKTITN